jgi:hypothetical protein
VHRSGVNRARISTRGLPALIAGMGLLAVIFGWGLPALIGCSESSDQPCARDVAYGRIVGRIEAAGVPIDASVFATGWELGDWPGETYEITSPVDDQGHFTLIVPVGEYTVAAYVEGHSYFYAADGAEQGYLGARDTLSVDTGDSVGVVFHFGCLIVEVAASAPELSDGDASLYIYQIDQDRRSVGSARSTTTISDGLARFTLPGVPAGNYALEFDPDRHDYSSETIWLPGTHDPAAAELVQVMPDVVRTYAAELPDRPAVIRGRVSGSWQRMGSSKCQLSVLAADSVVVLTAYASESDGSFRGEMWIPEPVRIACTIEGSTRWIGGDDFASATEFRLVSGEETDVGTIEESGLLVELIEPTFPNSSEFGLQLVRAEEGTLARTLWVSESRRGRTNLVPFLNLDPGVYYLRVNNSRLGTDWVSQWYDGVTALSEATPITVPGGGTVVPITLTLEAGGSISGRVLNDFEGAPSRFVIYVVEAATGETVGLIYCESVWGCGDDLPNRPFLGLGIADGEYRVGASPLDSSTPPWEAPAGTIWYPGTAEWEAAEIVTIADHAAVTGVDIAWPPSGPSPSHLTQTTRVAASSDRSAPGAASPRTK